MNSRSLILFVIAAVVAFGTAFFVRNYVVYGESDQKNTNVARVLVASEDISSGSFIRSESDLTWVDWPVNNINSSYILEGQMDINELSGAVARRIIIAGEPITKSLVVQAGDGGFMAAVLGPGKRAISIAVDSTTGNAGFIFPGDRVDLILTHSIPVAGEENSQKEILASETFIEDVRVLAVDQQTDNPENLAILAKTVTLEITKQQAEKINVAKDLGKISVSLRSLAQDQLFSESITKSTPTRDSDVSSILAPPDRQKSRSVMLIRGNTRETIQFGN